MAMRPGYKQTELGVIPDAWEVRTLRTCLSAQPDYGINAPAVPFSDRLPTYIRITDIKEDGRFSSEKPVSVKRADADLYYLNAGDIVFARTGASVGKSYLYNHKDGKLVFAGFLIRVRPDEDTLIPAYLAAYVTTSAYWDWVRLMSMRSGQPGINGQEYGRLLVPVPPPHEQKTIARVLSDADALIESLGQLVTKKRHLKQGAMQDLLTGKKRLPGFNREWGIVGLRQVCSMKSGESITSADIDQFSQYRCYGGNGLRGFTRRFTHDGNYALIGRQGALCGNVLDVDGKFFASEHAVVVTGSQGTDIHWLAFVLGRMRLNQYSESSAQPGLSVSKILNLELAFPPTKAEQTAIAAILTDMDTEIGALEAKLAKARQIKQGMMQELLTGRIRLV